MSISLTPAQLEALGPCDLHKRVVLFGKRKRTTVAQALAAGASLEDLLWVAGRLGLKEQCVRFALACAQRVAHLNPDPRVRAAFDTAQARLDNPTSENADAARAAARAAYVYAAETKEQTAIFLEIFG